MSELVELNFVPLEEIQPVAKNIHRQAATVMATLFLNRPEAANALSAEMMQGITAALGSIAKRKDCRLLVISGKGKHFCGGADLQWMQASAKLSHSENLEDAARLTAMFEGLANLAIPTVAVVQGSAFGGAVGLAACCDVVIASEKARFCLSEAKLGLIPAVILPYLARRCRGGDLRRFGLSARLISSAEAAAAGLVDVVANSEELNATLRQEINQLLTCGPVAQSMFKKLHQQVVAEGFRQGTYTAEQIAAARTGGEGQAGLAAFFAKAPAPWLLKVSDNWSVF